MIVLSLVFSTAVQAHKWKVCNNSDKEVEVLFKAEGCGSVHNCGNTDKEISEICKHAKLEPGDCASSNKSQVTDKRIHACSIGSNPKEHICTRNHSNHIINASTEDGYPDEFNFEDNEKCDN